MAQLQQPSIDAISAGAHSKRSGGDACSLGSNPRQQELSVERRFIETQDAIPDISLAASLFGELDPSLIDCIVFRLG
jgi:hypothetical protein